jgi:hypothetical protein
LLAAPVFVLPLTILQSLSSAYIVHASITCLRLPRQIERLPCSLTLCNAGINMAISTAMMAITTNNSIKVNPLVRFMMILLQPPESGRMAILADSGFLTAFR